MKCYYHQDRDAVGTCKSCQKGLCPECAVDLSHGLACKARCEDDVKNLNQLIQNNVKLFQNKSTIIKTSRSSGILVSTFYIVLGVVFAVAGYHEKISFVLILGGCFLAYGVILLIRVVQIAARQAKL